MLSTSARAFVVIPIVIGLSACSPESTPHAASSSAPASSTPTIGEKEATGPAYVVPSELASCTEGKVVTLKWDFRSTHPDVSDVEILTGAPTKETLFAAGGPNGEALTGAWAYPGTIFIIKNKADGTELNRVIVSGPSCLG